MKPRGESLLVIGTLLLLCGIVAFSAYGRWRIGLGLSAVGIALMVTGSWSRPRAQR